MLKRKLQNDFEDFEPSQVILIFFAKGMDLINRFKTTQCNLVFVFGIWDWCWWEAWGPKIKLKIVKSWSNDESDEEG